MPPCVPVEAGIDHGHLRCHPGFLGPGLQGLSMRGLGGDSMIKKPLAIFAQVLAALYGIYGLFPIVAATQLAEDPLWFQVVLGLAGAHEFL